MPYPFLSPAGLLRTDERFDLIAHVRCCARRRGRWFALRCAAEALHAVLAPRFVTSLVAVFALFGALTIAL